MKKKVWLATLTLLLLGSLLCMSVLAQHGGGGVGGTQGTTFAGNWSGAVTTLFGTEAF